jgi:pimeloyl-ACP methyl ester carboxylesterase
MWGDLLAERYPGLAIGMSLRAPGHDAIALDPDGLAAAFPDASGRIVVFVHGLCESDASWWTTDGEISSSYGSELSAELGVTALYLRCNTGLAVDRNGRGLSDLMERLVAGWPAAVDDVVLVGHSMGGLIARSACRHAHQQGRRWAAAVSHVVSLGTPHRGAPLERGVDAAVKVLATVPEVRPLAQFLHRRSAGVKDLAEGLAVRDERGDLPHATYSSVAATLTRDSDHPVARTLGDLLVPYGSASGMGHPIRPDVNDRGAHLGRTNHLQLLHHPSVSRQLRDWLAADRTTAAGTVGID